MTPTTIHFRLEVAVKFTDDELRLLVRCAANHYDGACKQAGALGGFLYGMSNVQLSHREPGATEVEHTLTFRQLDLLSKIVEVSSYLSHDARELGQSVAVGIHQIMRNSLKSLPELATATGGPTDQALAKWAVATLKVFNPYDPVKA